MTKLNGVYQDDIEKSMRDVYNSFSEKDRRRYAASEAMKLGRGGIAYVAALLECSRDSIAHGLREIREGLDEPGPDRIRRLGAGRPRIEQQQTNAATQVKETIQHRTAGDPMRDDVTWTDLSPTEISRLLYERFAADIRPRIVRRILRGLGFGRRKIAKSLCGKDSPDRDRQFRRIAEFLEEFEASGNPIISMDTKKKEFLGNLYRAGRIYVREPILAFDHDFPTWAEGVIIPHGLYDVVRNEGHLHLGLSHDTSRFACDSLRLYWKKCGRRQYPDADQLLLLCDGGGSNGSRTHIFKEDLQRLVNEIELPIRVCHYPAYCSKYNPIERRLFCHVTRACQGVLFDTLSRVRSLMEKTSTATGLSVTVRVMRKAYETGRAVSEAFKRSMPVILDTILPKWNYRIIPQ